MGKAVLAWLASLKKVVREGNGRPRSRGHSAEAWLGLAHLNRADAFSVPFPLQSVFLDPSPLCSHQSSSCVSHPGPRVWCSGLDVGLGSLSHLCVDALRFRDFPERLPGNTSLSNGGRSLSLGESAG